MIRSSGSLLQRLQVPITDLETLFMTDIEIRIEPAALPAAAFEIGGGIFVERLLREISVDA